MFALTEDDWDLLNRKARSVRAIAELDLESVAVRVRVSVVDALERAALEALEAARQIADGDAQDQSRVEAAAAAEGAPVERPVLDAAAVDVSRADHEVGVVSRADEARKVGGIVREVRVHLEQQLGPAGEGALEARQVRPTQALLRRPVHHL